MSSVVNQGRKTKQFPVSMSEDLKKEVEDKASDKGISQAALIRMTLKENL